MISSWLYTSVFRTVCLISDKIKELLKPGTVNTMTRLALVNAIYFKGNWMNRFDVVNTKEMPFKVNQVKTKVAETQTDVQRQSTQSDHPDVLILVCQNETKPVQMMYQMKKLPYTYIPEHSLHVLELPYLDNELSMFILLPEDSDNGCAPLLKVCIQELTSFKVKPDSQVYFRCRCSKTGASKSDINQI